MAIVRRPLGLLIDLSGTIHIEDKVIQGSIEVVNLLRRNGIPFLFVTNTTKVRNECFIFFLNQQIIKFQGIFSYSIHWTRDIEFHIEYVVSTYLHKNVCNLMINLNK